MQRHRTGELPERRSVHLRHRALPVGRRPRPQQPRDARLSPARTSAISL